MEVVVWVSIGVLALVFTAALVGLLILLCFKCKEDDLITQQHLKDTRPDAQLIEEDGPTPTEMGVELGTVQITSPRLEEALNEDHFLDESNGLVPHCLFILKSCHQLLVGISQENGHILLNQEAVSDINSAAKRITPRMDEVLHSMDSPHLDPRLLEARFTALVLSVSHLVMITKKVCHMTGTLDWIDHIMSDMEDHLRVLREVSASGVPQGSMATVEHHTQPSTGSQLANDNSEV